MSGVRWMAALFLFAALHGAAADGWEPEFGGHIKGQLVWTSFPDDSLFRDIIGSSALDLNSEARLKLSLIHI